MKYLNSTKDVGARTSIVKKIPPKNKRILSLESKELNNQNINYIIWYCIYELMTNGYR